MLIWIRYSLLYFAVTLSAAAVFVAGAQADEILDPPEILVPEKDLCEDLPEEATLTERIAAGCEPLPPVGTPPVDAPPAPPSNPPTPPGVPIGPPGVGVNTTSDA